MLISRLPYLNAPPLPCSLGFAIESVPDGPILQSPVILRQAASPRIYVEDEDSYWQEDTQVAWDNVDFNNLTPLPRPSTPDRIIAQRPSSTGKVAYVIFGDDSDGLFYNWYVF